MAVRQNPYPLRVETTIMAKFKVVALANARSVNKEIEMLMRIAIKNYEIENGIIQIPIPSKGDE